MMCVCARERTSKLFVAFFLQNVFFSLGCGDREKRRMNANFKRSEHDRVHVRTFESDNENMRNAR